MVWFTNWHCIVMPTVGVHNCGWTMGQNIMISLCVPWILVLTKRSKQERGGPLRYFVRLGKGRAIKDRAISSRRSVLTGSFAGLALLIISLSRRPYMRYHWSE